MFKKRKDLKTVSVEELEQMLRIRRREERQERFTRMSSEGAPANAALLSTDLPNYLIKNHQPAAALSSPTPISPPAEDVTMAGSGRQPKKLREYLLLAIEISVLVGLVAILISSYLNLRQLNDEVTEIQQASLLGEQPADSALASTVLSDAPASLSMDRLPGGHSSPTEPGGAVPDVPAHLQNWVQPPPAVPISTQSTAQATRIVVPKIGIDAPIIQGVSWEDLKKGVGHLPNSAQPGERGNLYLAAHNDIYGEIFRYLHDLEPGDEYYIYAGEEKFTYVVREKRIIEPTEVSVMLPTTEPVATLQTCYPYLIDTHRLVVVSDLLR